MIAFEVLVFGILDHIQGNIGEFFAEEPELAWAFMGMVFVGIPISLWVIYHGIQGIGFPVKELWHNLRVGGIRYAIQRSPTGSLAGAVMLVVIGLVMSVMSTLLFLLSVEEKFGYSVLSWLLPLPL